MFKFTTDKKRVFGILLEITCDRRLPLRRLIFRLHEKPVCVRL